MTRASDVRLTDVATSGTAIRGRGQRRAIIHRDIRLIKLLSKAVHLEAQSSPRGYPRWRDAAEWVYDNWPHPLLFKAASLGDVWKTIDNGRELLQWGW